MKVTLSSSEADADRRGSSTPFDFADKQEGYDVYPVQTIQPFGVLDSLSALGLSSPKGVSLTTLDLSDRKMHKELRPETYGFTEARMAWARLA